jgi:hypothetical protein
MYNYWTHNSLWNYAGLDRKHLTVCYIYVTVAVINLLDWKSESVLDGKSE